MGTSRDKIALDLLTASETADTAAIAGDYVARTCSRPANGFAICPEPDAIALTRDGITFPYALSHWIELKRAR